MVIISDASSLVLLQKIGLLEILIKKFEVSIPAEVYKEAVVRGKEKKSSDAYLIEEKIRNNFIKIKSVKGSDKVTKVIEEFGLGGGEAEAIILFLEQKADVLATDDHKAINACKIFEIPFITALTFILNAFEDKLIEKNKAKKMIEELGIYGRYKDELIYKALKYLGE